MTNILTLESPQELLRNRRKNILREIELYGERERGNLQQAMQARRARKELEALLFEFDNVIDTLEEVTND